MEAWNKAAAPPEQAQESATGSSGNEKPTVDEHSSPSSAIDHNGILATTPSLKLTRGSAVVASNTASGISCAAKVTDPLVAVIVSTTSRGVVKKGKTKELTPEQLKERMQWVEDTTKALDVSELVLFTTMMPSLASTVECGFRYHIVIGVDKGDLLFDTPETREKVGSWMEVHVKEPAAKRGVSADFEILTVENTARKPGPVFNAMAAAVRQNEDVEFIYRVNDDTEFASKGWTSKLVGALRRLGGPAYGVVGPSCPQGNRAILTHDFTHRTHMDIFEDYYPPVLTDWFMDDWISRVYGSKRTRLLTDVEVVHHSKTYGRRYDVDGKHRHLVDDLVEQGKSKILAYMRANGANHEDMLRFQKDSFNHRQSQKEVDQSTIARKSAAVRPPGH